MLKRKAEYPGVCSVSYDRGGACVKRHAYHGRISSAGSLHFVDGHLYPISCDWSA